MLDENAEAFAQAWHMLMKGWMQVSTAVWPATLKSLDVTGA
jgi:hypothetical protein